MFEAFTSLDLTSVFRSHT